MTNEIIKIEDLPEYTIIFSENFRERGKQTEKD